MIITYIIFSVSCLVWFWVIFRQKNSSIYLYFLILGLKDPLGLFTLYILKIPFEVLYIISDILILVALRTENFKIIKLKVLDYLIIIAVIISFIISFNLTYLSLVVHVFILINFIQRVIIPLHFKGELSVFFAILVFYETSLLVKGFMLVNNPILGMYLIYFTLAFQILIAIFFIIFREDNPKLIIKMT